MKLGPTTVRPGSTGHYEVARVGLDSPIVKAQTRPLADKVLSTVLKCDSIYIPSNAGECECVSEEVRATYHYIEAHVHHVFRCVVSNP